MSHLALIKDIDFPLRSMRQNLVNNTSQGKLSVGLVENMVKKYSHLATNHIALIMQNCDNSQDKTFIQYRGTNKKLFAGKMQKGKKTSQNLIIFKSEEVVRTVILRYLIRKIFSVC